MTAGHCVNAPNKLGRQQAFHNGLPVGIEPSTAGSNFADLTAPPDNNWNDDAFPHFDWALMLFPVTGNTQWHQYWFTNRSPRNQILAYCTTPSANGCTNGLSTISSVEPWSSIITDEVVCATGSGYQDVYPGDAGYSPGTRCGEVRRKDMVDYLNGGPGGFGIDVNICSRDGDSGGPLWDQETHSAIGILSGGPPDTTKTGSDQSPTGPCTTNSWDESSVYSSVSEDLADAAARTGLSFNVVMTANG
jgi:streptogrisin C